MKPRPKVRSKNYFKYMSELIEKAEALMGISVYGFSDYCTISFYFKHADGTLDRNPCTCGVSILEERVNEQTELGK